MSAEKPQVITHITKGLNYTVYDGKWIPSSSRFVILGSNARGTGQLEVYDMLGTEVKEISKVEKKLSFKCGTFGASPLTERHLATGNFGGGLQTWDLERLDMPVYNVHKAHTEIINAIDGVAGNGPGAPEIVTGSRDGSVKIWDTRQRDVPVADFSPEPDAGPTDCWAVAFGNTFTDEERCVCAGYDNGDVKMFDLRTMSVRWQDNVKNGVCGVEFDRRDIAMNKLIVTGLESKFHAYDLRTFHEEKGYASTTEVAHKSTIWTARHLPQNRDVFMTGGGNGSVCLWKYRYPPKRFTETDGVKEGVPGTLEMLQNQLISTQPISSIDWSPDKLGLALCTSFDQSFRILFATKLASL